MNSEQFDRTEEIIANGRKLVKQAQEALEATERFFAEHNIDPQDIIENLRRVGGEAAVDALKAEVETAKKEIEDEISREMLHGSMAKPPRHRMKMNRNAV